MFMIVGYPWPIAAPYAELGDDKVASAAMRRTPRIAGLAKLRVAQIEDLVRWTRPERMRLGWYRLRLAMSDRYHAARYQ
jgi:hypothetical protein